MDKNVLFQKILDKWYIFVEINGEIYAEVLPKGIDPRTCKFEVDQVINKIKTKEIDL